MNKFLTHKIRIQFFVLFFLFSSFCLKSVNGQMVYMPDSNFRNALMMDHSSCIVGDSIDSTCPSVVIAIGVNVAGSNVYDLQGIQAFTNIQVLFCQHDSLTYLPPLPNGLQYLDCSYNRLTNIAALPNSLQQLECSSNKLTTLPALPSSLFNLTCVLNQIISLPTLPDSLLQLACNGNQLVYLPALPNSLHSLSCSYNNLTSLPSLPNNLFEISCEANQITSLPELPDSMDGLNCSLNPYLTCLPQLKIISYLEFSQTAVSCLPNYVHVISSNPPLNSIPLCGMFNSVGCSVFWNITGKSFFDDNTNCIFDSIDIPQQNMHVLLYENGNLVQQVFTGDGGHYSFDTDVNRIYSVKLDTSNIQFSLLCPINDSYSDTLNNVDSLFYDNDFSLKCKPGYDVGVWNIYTSRFRPGGISKLIINAGDLSNFYGAHCAEGVSGTVTITLNGPVNYIGPDVGALTPTNVSGNILTYSIADFGITGLFNSFNILVITNTNAIINTPVCIHVEVNSTGSDNNPSNDTLTQCFYIVNSWDPNEKIVSPSGDVDLNGDHWLTYTINFQNTGNASAEHIYITDTLDANLDLSTFQLLAYSFQPLVQILDGGIARFNFPNINLADSNSNEPASHGYIQYKIKFKNNLTPGTHINNTGYIYFDFNSPIITNTTSSTLQFITNISTAPGGDLQFSIYPNPTNGNITLNIPQYSPDNKMFLRIFNVLGQEILFMEVHASTMQLQATALAKGVYILEVHSSKQSTKKKLVVE